MNKSFRIVKTRFIFASPGGWDYIAIGVPAMIGCMFFPWHTGKTILDKATGEFNWSN
jgi:hypothetical protein